MTTQLQPGNAQDHLHPSQFSGAKKKNKKLDFIEVGPANKGGEDPDHGATLTAAKSNYKVPASKMGNEALDKHYQG